MKSKKLFTYLHVAIEFLQPLLKQINSHPGLFILIVVESELLFGLRLITARFFAYSIKKA